MRRTRPTSLIGLVVLGIITQSPGVFLGAGVTAVGTAMFVVINERNARKDDQ